MGRMLGAYDSDELDRPDLNKCPDCGCYFATDDCPLCGKICPEEMRAGNRAAVKKKKRRKNTSGRVQFIPFYYSWWFMIIISLIFPLAGMILFITSPYSTKIKVIVVAVLVAFTVLVSWGVGGYLLDRIFEEDEPEVNDTLSKAEYMDKCAEMTATAFYRNTQDGTYATLTLTVTERIVDDWSGDDKDIVYYVCTDGEGKVSILIRDCVLEGSQRYMAGDQLRVWGESRGLVKVYRTDGSGVELPCLYMAYGDLIG